MDPPVVVDCGSGYMKGGIAGKFLPSVVFDSVLGKPKTVGVHPGMGMNDRYVGDEALAKRLVLDLTNPIQKGVIKDWEGFDKLLKHTFNQLKIHSEEQPLLLGEGMFVPESQRQKVAELCYEKFGVRGFFMATESVMATYGAGRSTSLVIDFGDQKTEFVPVTEGTVSAILFNANKRLNLGGSNLTDELCRTLRMSGYNFNTQAERELVRTMKEQMCFVAQDFDDEMKRIQKKRFTLPDGQVISFGIQCFQVPESYFRPAMAGLEDTPGITQLIAQSIDKNNHETMFFNRRHLAESVVIVGGSSLLPGLADRIRKEMLSAKGLVPVDRDGNPKWEVKIYAPNHRKYATWYGGSVFAPFASFVTQEQYDELGPASVALAHF